MNRKYFDDCKQKCKQVIMIGDIYCRKAEFYNRLYKITKWKWAKDKNQYYVNEGTKLLVGSLGVCLMNISILEKYMKEFGE